ncbi:hypothetical protein SAMN05216360_106245 [Methylobacterium phyllostachyos]|uniref:SpoVT-AbrB domain-containing protein n=1 Tax=Methylobacterium phyllostachyos TaxID=582672 RepID=A0A1G9ZEW4_9HYPH|nr:hypothetical protein [Methylobacterium phyllostachyos]SDN19868.1 hypothetical protein SAMN05216360_106245 [Methylobacterium phyllostachyos]
MKRAVTRIGNATGLILPEALRSRLNLQRGQWLRTTELPVLRLNGVRFLSDQAQAIAAIVGLARWIRQSWPA